MICEPVSLYRLLTPSDYVRMPWKNGLGETLEIAVKSDHLGIAYRVSQAEVVNDGEFSDFSGLQRTLVLLGGKGMKLTHSTERGYQVVHELYTPLAVARFSGSDKTYATLVDGPIADLNIMVREGQVSASVEPLCPAASVKLHQHTHALYAGFFASSDSEVLIQDADSKGIPLHVQRVQVPSGHTLEFTAAVKVSVVTGFGVAVDIRGNSEPNHGRYFNYSY